MLATIDSDHNITNIAAIDVQEEMDQPGDFGRIKESAHPVRLHPSDKIVLISSTRRHAGIANDARRDAHKLLPRSLEYLRFDVAM